MSCKKIDIAKLDKWFPPRGPCAFCGHRDARHRLWDTFMSHSEAGDTAREIQRWFVVYPIKAIRAVLRVRPYRRGKRK